MEQCIRRQFTENNAVLQNSDFSQKNRLSIVLFIMDKFHHIIREGIRLLYSGLTLFKDTGGRSNYDFFILRKFHICDDQTDSPSLAVYFCDMPYLCDYDRPFFVFLFGRVSDLPAVFSNSISCSKQKFLDSLLF